MGTNKFLFIMLTIFILITLINSSVAINNIGGNNPSLKYIKNEIKNNNADWNADYNNIFTKERNYVKNYLGANIKNALKERNDTTDLETSLASSSFDWRDVEGINYITAIKNQGGCGSCVAFAAIAVLEAVIQIETDIIFDSDLSESHLFFCGGGSCGMGWYLDEATNFIKNTGVVDELCFPYNSYDMDCNQKEDNWRSRTIQIKKSGSIYNNEEIKQALIEYGPLLASFHVYEDFSSYSSGVYEHVWGKVVGGHAIAIIGFNDTGEYWICKNSWGPNWGENGFFNIKYGECGIDTCVYYFDGITGNIQPSKPEVIYPDEDATELETTIEVKWKNCTDIDGNLVSYDIYLNEGNFIDFNEDPIASGLLTNNYQFQNLKKDRVYVWQVFSEDEKGSQHTDGKYRFTTRKPRAPSVSGPEKIQLNVSHTFTASTLEKNGSEYYWYFQWGDGENSGWLGPYQSGKTISISHEWQEKGTYEVKVKYKEDGVESEKTILELSSPKNNELSSPVFSRLVDLLSERFPFVEFIYRFVVN